MAIEEDKVRNLIKSYEAYEEECRDSGSEIDLSRAGLYRTAIADLRLLLPRRSLADLGISEYGELTGMVAEYEGRRGILLGGNDDLVRLFIFAWRSVALCNHNLVYLLDEERAWDEAGIIL